MNKQPLAAQMGEIKFREMLYQQQVGNQAIFDDELDTARINEVLVDRMRKTLEDVSLLKYRDIALSPYLEIGAERCQRSLVLENDLDCRGAAADISFFSLKSCDYYCDAFHNEKKPLRVCCDINSLPFRSNSLPFVMCYQTLHHFPDPAPIIDEIYRVLAPGGHFFFDEEPFKCMAHVNLIKDVKIYSPSYLKAGFLKKAIYHLFAELSCNETDHGIIENDNIPLKTWDAALSPFKDREVTLTLAPSVRVRMHALYRYLTNPLASLTGGMIKGLCRKPGAGRQNYARVEDTLACPECLENGHEEGLAMDASGFSCDRCGARHPVVDGVLFLFTGLKMRELYPALLPVPAPLIKT